MDGKDETKELALMLNEPKKAIVTMSLPLLVAFFISNIQLFVDSFWCSGLGPESMSAISITGSLYWVIIDVGTGMGVGVSTAVARALGASDRNRANSLLSQSLALGIAISILTAVAVLVVSDPILLLMGGEEIDLSLCKQYLYPYLLSCIPLILYGIMVGMMRGEGAAKKTMYLSVSASIINIILDPIMIYSLGLGVLGASVTTCISFIVVVAIGLAWYSRDKMYLKPSFKGFRFKKDELYDIARVGVPHTAELVLIPLMMIPQNMFVVQIGGQDGIVCNFTPYRFIALAAVLAQSLSSAMIPVSSAAIGQKDYKKAVAGFRYTTKMCIISGLILSVLVFVLAGPLSYVFTYSEDMARFQAEFVKVIRIYSFVILFLALIDVSSSILQTIQHSTVAMCAMFFRECLFILFYWISTFISMDAIYWSLLLAQALGATVMVICATHWTKKTFGDACVQSGRGMTG